MSGVLDKIKSGVPLSRLEKEMAKREQAHKVVLLLDTSGSMSSQADSPGERRIDALRGVVASLQQQSVPYKQLVFNTDCAWSDIIPEPTGGTNLSGALEFVEKISPQHLIVVSDGEPDSQEATLAIAKRLGCKIDVFYVGPKGSPGEAFLKQLAKSTGGSAETVSFKELTAKIAGILAASNSEAKPSEPIAL